MKFLPLLLTSLTLAAPAFAQLACFGTDPNWSIELDGDSANFTYLDRQTTHDIPHQAIAENDPDTIAYTLIGRRDTAILLVHPGACNTHAITAHVMTQDRGEAILLSGCCTDTNE